MGCCFSKEVSSDRDSEKAGLLPESVQEAESGHQISKALSSLFDTLEGEELPSVRHGGGGGAAAGAALWVRPSTRPGPPRGLRLSSDSGSPAVPQFLPRSESFEERETNSEAVALEHGCGRVSVPRGVSSVGERGFSEDIRPKGDEALSSGQGVQGGALVGSHLGRPPAARINALTEHDRVVNVQIRSDSSSSDRSGGGVTGRYPVCSGHQAHGARRESELYSVCVVDPDSLGLAEEPCAPVCGAAAGEDSCSAVTSEGLRRGARPPGKAAQGPGQLAAPQEERSPRGMPSPNERKEVFKENTKPALELTTVSLRAHAYTGFPRDCTESSAVCNAGTLPARNRNVGTSLPGRVCARPEGSENCSLEQVSPTGDSHVDSLTHPSETERNGESGAVAANVGQSFSSEKEREDSSLRPLKDRDYFRFDVSRPEGSLLPRSLDRIHPSWESCVPCLSLRNQRLPVHASFREAARNGPDDAGPARLLGPAMAGGQQPGVCGLRPGSLQPVNKAHLSLQSESSSSYPDGDKMSSFEEEGHEQRACAWRPSHQVADLRADPGASAAQAQICDVAAALCKTGAEGVFPRAGTPELGSSQEAPPDGKSLDGSRCLQGSFISSAFAFAGGEERATGPCVETEGVVCVKSAASGWPGSGSARKESLKASPRETREDDRGDVKSDAETTSRWGASAAPRGAARRPATSTAPPGGSSRRPPSACRREGPGRAPPLSQGSSAGEQRSQAGETDSVHSREEAGLQQVCSDSAEERAEALGGGAAGTSRPAAAGQGRERDSIHACRVSTHARHVGQSRARPVPSGPAWSGGVDVVASPQVTVREVELGETPEACSRVAPVDGCTDPPHEVLQVVPVPLGDGAEIAVPLGGARVFPLPGDAVNTPVSPAGRDLPSFPGPWCSPSLHEPARYPVGAFASATFSEGLADGCREHPGGCACAGAVGSEALEEEQVPSACLHGRPPAVEVALFWLEQPPYRLPAAEEAVLWGWQSRGGQSVSMFIGFYWGMLGLHFEVLFFK